VDVAAAVEQATPSPAAEPRVGFWPTLSSLCRPHIVAIAALAALVFGWLFDGAFHAGPPLLVGLDWFLLNLWNRLADLPEDRRNGVAGATFAASHRTALGWGATIVFLVSLPISAVYGWPLVAFRLLFQAGGYVYSFRPTALPRLKEVYLVKNVASGVLFLISVFGYPLLAGAAAHAPSALEVFWLMAFFLPFEITYELLYDLRDVAGDRAEGIRTVAVVKGERGTRRLIGWLLLASAAALVVGFCTRSLAFAELVMVAAPLQQWILVRWPLRDAVTQRGAVVATWLGAAQLLSFALWVAAGLPVGPGR
jgi:4-hydroxybenzoate polyprenyltransferase